MKTSIAFSRTAIIALAFAAAAAPMPAAAQAPEPDVEAPAAAQAPEQEAAAPAAACPVAAASQKPAKRRGGLGGLLRSVRQSGVGNMLGSGLLGDSRTAQIAGTVADVATNAESGGNPVEAIVGQVAPQVADGRAGQVASVVAGTIANAAQQAQADCSSEAAG